MIDQMSDDSRQHGKQWRRAAWAAATVILLLPLIAMQFTDEVNWTGSDFLVGGILLFGALGAYEIVARKTTETLYRAGVGVGIAASLLLIWGNGAVSITDSAADAFYYGAALVGIVSVAIAIARPLVGARAMLAAAIALATAFAATLIGGFVPNPYVSVFELTGITVLYVVLFGGAAWLLRESTKA